VENPFPTQRRGECLGDWRSLALDKAHFPQTEAGNTPLGNFANSSLISRLAARRAQAAHLHAARFCRNEHLSGEMLQLANDFKG
jgi:hypothetical protein